MSLETCIGNARQWMKDTGFDKVSEQDLQQMGRILDQAGGEALTKAQYADLLQTAVENMQERRAAKNLAQQALDLTKTATNIKNTLLNSETMKDPIKAGMSQIQGGALKMGVGSNLSPRQGANGMIADYFTALRRGLGENLKVFQSGALDKDFYQVMDGLNNGTSLEGMNETAIQIAKEVKAVQNMSLRDRQSQSPFLEAAKDFIVERNHDPAKVSGDGSPEAKAAWMKDAQEAFGKKSLLGLSPQEKEAAFSSVFDRIKAGVWGTNDDKFDSNSFWGLKGAAADLARSMAKGRFFQAENWQAEFKYASKYGNGAYDAVTNSLKSTAHDFASLQKWGSKAQDGFETWFNGVKNGLSEEGQAKWENGKKQLIDAFAVSRGSQNTPANNWIGNTTAGMLQFQSLAKTGLHIARALPDLQNAVTMIKTRTGASYPEIYAGVVSRFLDQIRPLGNSEEHLGDLALMGHSGRDAMNADVGAPGDKPGVLARMVEVSGKLAGTDRFTNGIQRGAAGTLMAQWGRVADTSFDKLNPQAQIGLKSYGLEGPAWELARQGVQTMDHPAGGKAKLITMEGIRGTSDEAAAQYARAMGLASGEGMPSQRILDAARADVAYKWGAATNEVASWSSGLADLRQRNFMMGNSDINSGRGAFWRLVGEFKAPAFLSNDIMRQAALSNQTMTGSSSAVITHLLGSMALGLIGDYAIQAIGGNKTPESPLTGAMLARSFVNSGGGGIYADGLINALQGHGAKNDYVARISEGAAGPAAGLIADLIGSSAASVSAKNSFQKKQAAGNWASLVQNNTPFHNILWLKAVLQYNLFNGLHEWMGDHGHAGMLERSMNQTPALGGGMQKRIVGQ